MDRYRYRYRGRLNTNFRWIVFLLIGFSRNRINDGISGYSLHITPFIEVSINFKGVRNGSKLY